MLLKGEKIYKTTPHIGLLHRGTEKLFEHKIYIQNTPYFDRLDYVSMLSQEHCYALVIEKMLNIKINKRIKIIRMLVVEITRILNHLMALTTHALDIGAVTLFLQGFEEREKLLEFYERLTGARMHTNYIIPGGVMKDIPFGFINDLQQFSIKFFSRLNELEDMLTVNRIQKNRLINIGIVSLLNSRNFGLSGVLLRSLGIEQDLRKIFSYELYDKAPFNTIISYFGDCYDRYLIRVCEMRESIYIIFQCIRSLLNILFRLKNFKINLPIRKTVHIGMEEIIHHFKLYTEGFISEFNITSTSIESPKGEFSLFVAAEANNRPWRCKVKAPGFLHLGSINIFSLNLFIADIVTIIGTQDIVFGEIDK